MTMTERSQVAMKEHPGEYDYFVKVAVDGTEGYERFLRERLYRIPGIRHTRSCFALRCLKRRLSVTP